MENNNSLAELLRNATYDEEPEDDDVSMADPSSHHEDEAPSDHTASTPSDADPDGASEPATTKSNAATKKRKQTGLDADGNPKPVKKRASQACEICRSRKVRCDSEKRHPCTNCADMGLVCHIPESKRRRRHLHAPASTHSILPNPPPTQPKNFSSQSANDDSALHAHAVDSPVPMGCRSPQQLYRTYGGGPIPQAHWGPNEEAQAWRALVPPFVKPSTPAKVTREGLRYLQHMGALDLPGRDLEKQLLLAYIEHVHPDFPVLELHDFMRRVGDRSGRHGQVSLLLYQSVMFAASAFIRSEHLSAAGFSNRRALRRAVFQAAKLLHDFDYENDKFTLVQSTLLLSFWYEAPDDSKETWHWSGIAISQAQALGLHRSTVNSSNMDPVKRKQRRRVWWSCVMRDRQIGLGMSRLIRIKDEDFDIPELQEDDFDLATLDDNPLVTRDDCPLAYDVGMQQELAEMCVQKARLYVLVGHVLQTVQSFQVATTDRNRTRSVAAIIEGNLEIFEAVHRELVNWAAALPPSSRYRPLQHADTEHGRTPVAMQRSLLHMLYQTTIGKVYHPLVRGPATAASVARGGNPADQQQQPSPNSNTTELRISLVARQKCKEAAAEITRMAGEMHEHGLDRYFPTTGVTVIMPAMLMHLQDVSDPVRAAREDAQRGFDVCMGVLNVLRETYAAAEYAAIFMDNVIRNKPGLERPPPPAPHHAGGGLTTANNNNNIPAQQQQAPREPFSGPAVSVFAAINDRSDAYAPLLQSRDPGAQRPNTTTSTTKHNNVNNNNDTAHPGLNEMGLANMPVMSHGGLGSDQTMQVGATFPETSALLNALGASATDAPSSDPWPIELVSSHGQHPSSSTDASMSPENTSEGSYTLVSSSGGDTDTLTIPPGDLSVEIGAFDLASFAAGAPGGDISAEGLNMTDDGWQNWLNLPPESDIFGDGGGGIWATGAPEHIDPGALNPGGPEVFG